MLSQRISLQVRSYVRNLSSIVKSGNDEMENILSTIVDESASLGHRKIMNLEYFASGNQTLKVLKAMNINLTLVERFPGAANFLIKADFQKHIKPVLIHLNDCGFTHTELKKLVQTYPMILHKGIHYLDQYVEYFIDHGFSKEQAVRLIANNPLLLDKPLIQMDALLGLIQKTYQLKLSDFRSMLLSNPHLTSVKEKLVKDNFIVFTKYLDISLADLREAVVTEPVILTTKADRLMKNFALLHDQLQLPKSIILRFPQTLPVQYHILHDRLSFLVHSAKFPLNPEDFDLPLDEVISGTDDDFCNKFGDCTIQQYDEFLKTL